MRSSRLLHNTAVAVLAIALVAGFAFHLDGPTNETSPSQASPGPNKHEEAEQAIELTDAKIAAAGIELVTARPGVLNDGLLLNGIIQPNQEVSVQVTPRFPGVVREVRKRIGDRVSKGDRLATIESNQSLTSYELTAPISGTIIDRQVSLGEYASEQKPAFVITDLSTVWIDFSVYRRDLARAHVGDTIMIDAEDGGAPIEAKISYVSPVGSSDTQSALARAVVGNNDMRLRPGLFVTGRLLLTAKPVGIAVVSDAIQTVANRTVVFVRAGEKFEVRNVEIGARDLQLVEIASGLVEGDVYAAKNSFVIKAELAKGSAGED
jgi:multidrug efflux pump subunit AcrA (membrane-fusion protein)